MRSSGVSNKDSCSLWVGVVFKYTKAELRRFEPAVGSETSFAF